MIELMVVLVIAVVMSTVVAMSMQPALQDAKMRSACRMVASSLNYARSHAAATNTRTRLVFDQNDNIETVETHVYKTDDSGTEDWQVVTTAAGKHYNLPEGITISQITKPGTEDNENWVEFTGTGQVEETRIELTDGKDQLKYVSVDPMTGRCQVRSYEQQQQYESADSVQVVK